MTESPHRPSCGLNQDACALWLMLRRDGGWWTVTNLVHYWRPTWTAGEVQSYLDVLVGGDFLIKRQTRGQRDLWEYAVTAACEPLPGLQLKREASRLEPTMQLQSQPSAHVDHHMGNHAIKSRVRQCIVAFLQTRRYASLRDIDQALSAALHRGDIDAHNPGLDLHLLRHQMNHLQAQGHVHRLRVDGKNVWAHGPLPNLQALDDSDAHEAQARVVPPRQINVMGSGNYVPPRQTLRLGALDYQAIPSLHMGRRRQFRGEVA